MNDPLDNMLRTRCAAARPSTAFEAAMARVLDALESPSAPARDAGRPPRTARRATGQPAARRRLPHWAPRAAAIVGAIVLCAGTTAYAAEKLGFSLWQTDAHQVQVAPPGDDAPIGDDVGENQVIDEYRLTFSYIPESLPHRIMDVDTGYFSIEEGFEGWSQFAPSIEYYTYYIDTDEPVSFSAIENADLIEVGGRQAALLEFDYGVRDSKRQTHTRLYVAFPEERRVVRLQTSDAALRDELVAIARGMALEPTGAAVPLKFNPTWSDAVTEANQDAQIIAERSPDDYSDWSAFANLAWTDAQMGPLLNPDQPFPLPGSESLVATVTRIEFHDDASLVDREAMPFGWRALLSADDRIAEDTLSFVKLGDGQGTADVIVKQADSPLKLLEVQVTLANEETTTQSDIRFAPRLESTVHRDGVWSQYRRADECPEADEVQNSLHVNDRSCSYVERLDDGSIGGIDRRLGSLGPGETTTVRYLWLVNADEADKLLLDIDPDGCATYADGTHGQRFVDIRS